MQRCPTHGTAARRGQAAAGRVQQPAADGVAQCAVTLGLKLLRVWLVLDRVQGVRMDSWTGSCGFAGHGT